MINGKSRNSIITNRFRFFDFIITVNLNEISVSEFCIRRDSHHIREINHPATLVKDADELIINEYMLRGSDLKISYEEFKAIVASIQVWSRTKTVRVYHGIHNHQYEVFVYDSGLWLRKEGGTTAPRISADPHGYVPIRLDQLSQ